MYQFVCDFGSFAVGAIIIGGGLYALFNMRDSAKRERELERHLQEHNRKRGGM